VDISCTPSAQKIAEPSIGFGGGLNSAIRNISNIVPYYEISGSRFSSPVSILFFGNGKVRLQRKSGRALKKGLFLDFTGNGPI
jgi:hypothetical protein